MPSACYLNNMKVSETNELLKSLRQWGSMLIERCHSFQNIIVPRAVSEGKIPSNQCHRKVKGFTLHISLDPESNMYPRKKAPRA